VILLAATPLYAQQSDLPDLGDPSMAVMSADQEHRLGRSWLRSLRGQAPIMEDPVVQEYAESLVYRLASFSELNEPDLAIVVINTPDINAFAVPGGVIGLNAGLFLNAASDDEVASVIAHEIAHVSQRHFSRRYIQSQKMNIGVLAAMLASIAVAIAGDGQAGMAGMAATQAGALQAQLAYSRSNEREADRVGMQTLSAAGLDPEAMPRFFERMLEQQRYAGDPPEFLLTHPVTEDRVADTRARARNLPHPNTHPSEQFLLVRARVQSRYFDSIERSRSYFNRQIDSGNNAQRQAARYGLALTDLRERDYDGALQRMAALNKEYPDELWYDLGLMEINLAKGDYPAVIDSGRKVLRINPRDYGASVLLSRAYLLNKKPAQALPLLEPLLLRRPGDPQLWSLAADAWGNSGDQARAHRGRAEVQFLHGQDRAAFQQMRYALKEASGQFALHSQLSAREEEMKKLSKEEF
tara:strand:- start:8144 stop:9547 length:1404 start_codon:yes stop_codon:yes gene_type:complete